MNDSSARVSSPGTSTNDTSAVGSDSVTQNAAPPVGATSAQQGGLNITVRSPANLSLALQTSALTATPGQVMQLPLTVTNTGNRRDRFRLETDLPADYQPTFILAQSGADSGLPILVTQPVERGTTIDVMLTLRVPETATNGQQRRFLVRAVSESDFQVARVANGTVNIIEATLSAVANLSQSSVMPGITFTQTITVRNNSSLPISNARADFVFNPNFELIRATPNPAYDRDSRTAVWQLGTLGANEARDIYVTVRATADALATTDSPGRGTVRAQSVQSKANFDAPSVTIGGVPRARIESVSVGLTAAPGETIYFPFIVRNPGNSADAYELRVAAPDAPVSTIYADTNGDGQHQDGEPAITQTPQLDPLTGRFPILLAVQIPVNTTDRQQYSYSIVARSVTGNRVASEANTKLTVAMPRVRVRTEQITDSSAPGDTIFYRLVLVNEGSGLAKNLVVTETLPDALQFLNADPALRPQDASSSQRFVWRVAELAPGGTAVLRVAVRLRSNSTTESSLTTRHTVSYQDSNGNNYPGQ